MSSRGAGRTAKQRPRSLHLSELFSLWTSEPERRFPLEPRSSDWLTQSYTHNAKHRLGIHTMLYPDTPETVHRCKLMGNMNLTSLFRLLEVIVTDTVAARAGETSTNITPQPTERASSKQNTQNKSQASTQC